ncbi:MAG: hypothetical protein K6E24_00585 [bacterium]|nr:hypothetical protein [bacterium]
MATKYKLSVKKTVVPEEEKFKMATKVNTTPSTPITVSFVPTEGDIVRTYKSNMAFYLGSPVGKGGEGTVYAIGKNLACKIYSLSKLTRAKIEKIKLMISKPIYDQDICWPIDLVMNSYNEIVGYTMPIAKGFLLSKIQSRAFVQEYFPKWKKKDIVTLAYTIIQKFYYLHERNIIVGDINTRNIMFTSPTQVYFVDTDSYQIEGFPCPVGTNEFTCRELLEKGSKFSDCLRQWGHENFSLAILIYVLFMNGKHPYAIRGGSDPATNIKQDKFPFPYEANNSKGVIISDSRYIDLIPVGPWKLYWEMLPDYIRGAFAFLIVLFSTSGKPGKISFLSEFFFSNFKSSKY